MRKIVFGFVLAISFFGVSQAVLAQGESGTSESEKSVTGILPAPNDGVKGADKKMTCGAAIYKTEAITFPDGKGGDTTAKISEIVNGKRVVNQGALNFFLRDPKNITLGNKIKGGCVQLSDIPFIVIHLIDLCTKLAGTIAVIFLLYAGFQMIVSGVSDDREAAKNTIKYAITGLIVSFLAWVIVNLVQVQLTS